jgi:hypothetical protein
MALPPNQGELQGGSCGGKSLLPDDLEYHVRQGCPALDGIVVNADAVRTILTDEWDPDFLKAIVYERGTVPEIRAAGLEQARKFVLYDEGAPPSQLSARSVDAIQSWIAERG